MRKRYLGAFLVTMLLATLPATAVTQAAAIQACTTYKETASSIMKLRQQESPQIQLAEALERFGKTDMGEVLVLKAYNEPKYGELFLATRAEQRFSGEVMLRCYTAYRNFGFAHTEASALKVQK